MNTEPASRSGLVREIFASVQGEGKYLGRTQFFVRLSGCNLACPYCDTRHSPARKMSADAVIEAVEGLRREHGAPHSVSITGGEPMFQPRLCAEIMRQLRARGYATYLETNATLPDAEVIGLCDIISADIKAPEDAATTDDIWDRHKTFLRAAAGKDLFVKMPVSTVAGMPGVTIEGDMAALQSLLDALDPLPHGFDIVVP